MSEREDELRLERELRDLLSRRDPGQAPYPLRSRLDRVPEEVRETRRGWSLALGAMSLAATAAAAGLLVAVLGGIVRGNGGIGAGPGTTTPGAGASTQIVFDPTTTGLGVVSPLAPVVPFLPLLVAVVVASVLVRMGWRHRGRLRVRSATWLAAAVIAGIGVAGMLVAPPVHGRGWATTEGTAIEATTPGVTPVRVTAGPGEPFQVVITLENRDLLPIRIEGFVDEYPDTETGGPTMSAWFDRELGSMGMPELPFEPFELAPGADRVIEIVRIADRCAIPGIPVQADAPPVGAPLDSSLEPQSSLRVRWSVLGWPREDVVPLPFQIRTYLAEGCDPTR